MKAPPIETLPPSKVPEAKAFLLADAALERWKEKHAGAYAELKAILETRDATLGAADKAVRERDVKCGPWDLYQRVRKDNAKILYAAVGRQKFAASGGVIEPSETLKVDRERFDALVATGKVAEELARDVVGWEPRYHAPPKLFLP